MQYTDAFIDHCFEKQEYIPKTIYEKDKLASINDFSPENVKMIIQILTQISESQKAIILVIENRNYAKKNLI